MNKTIKIDGALGEGGGQVLRTSLSLSMITAKKLELKNIRAGRKKPGLLRQHLTCVKAASEISGAQITGDSLGSQELSFNPASITGGDYKFSVGSAGSAMLVLQTVLPALMLAEKESNLILEGGTHNPMAPPFHYIKACFVPQLEKMGVKVDMSLERWGFYPAGGGIVHVKIHPCPKLKSVNISERGKLIHSISRVITTKIPESIGETEAQVLKEKLDWKNIRAIHINDSVGPGNIITAEMKYENITEMICEFGTKGVRAQKVASKVAKEVNKYLNNDAPVGEYLADQLLLPMALAGQGSFICQTVSSHTKTNIEVIQKFIDVIITITKENQEMNLIKIGP
jgi:RNA 3'-terminal phosphate cyclase (ATP)